MMYQDGSVSKNVRYQELCEDIFREAFKKDKEMNQWEAFIHKHAPSQVTTDLYKQINFEIAKKSGLCLC